MLKAFIWGIIATSSLAIGGLIGSSFNLSKKFLGVVMAFGAGVLLSAVAYELVFESVKLAIFSGFPLFGFFTGAFVFYFSDRIISNLGGSKRKAIGVSHASSLIVPMVLAIILDGVPESLVIGLGILETGTVSLAMLVAVFISNLPEAIAGTVGMKSGGWSKRKVLVLWLLISILCAGFSTIGYAAFENVSHEWLSFVSSFAGGAILMMLSNTMIPEAYEHGGKLAGVFTVLGFTVAVMIVLLEKQEEVKHFLDKV